MAEARATVAIDVVVVTDDTDEPTALLFVTLVVVVVVDNVDDSAGEDVEISGGVSPDEEVGDVEAVGEDEEDDEADEEEEDTEVVHGTARADEVEDEDVVFGGWLIEVICFSIRYLAASFI